MYNSALLTTLLSVSASTLWTQSTQTTLVTLRDMLVNESLSSYSNPSEGLSPSDLASLQSFVSSLGAAGHSTTNTVVPHNSVNSTFWNSTISRSLSEITTSGPSSTLSTVVLSPVSIQTVSSIAETTEVTYQSTATVWLPAITEISVTWTTVQVTAAISSSTESSIPVYVPWSDSTASGIWSSPLSSSYSTPLPSTSEFANGYTVSSTWVPPPELSTTTSSFLSAPQSVAESSATSCVTKNTIRPITLTGSNIIKPTHVQRDVTTNSVDVRFKHVKNSLVLWISASIFVGVVFVQIVGLLLSRRWIVRTRREGEAQRDIMRMDADATLMKAEAQRTHDLTQIASQSAHSKPLLWYPMLLLAPMYMPRPFRNLFIKSPKRL